MNELDKLKERRDATLKAAQEIISTASDEGREVTPEESTKFDTLMGQYKGLDSDIGRREQVQIAEEKLTQVTRQIEPEQISPVAGTTRIEVMPAGNGREIRGFTGPNAYVDAYRAGMWCRAALYGDGDAKDWCREQGVEARVMTTGVNTTGGFFVPTEMETAIIKLREDYGMARQTSQIRPMASDSEVIPRQSTGVTAFFAGESEATQDSDLGLSQVRLVAKELSALTYVSKNLAADSVVDVAGEVTNAMAWAFAKKEDNCFVDGDGTSQYGGIVGFRTKMIDGNHTAALIEATSNDDQFVELLLADIISLIGVLPQYALAQARWYISPYAWGAAFLRLLGAQSGNAIQNLTAGADKEFMGYPVVIAPAMPGKAATNWNDEVMIAFGDLKLASTFGDRKGITIEVDSSRRLEYRQLAILGTERFDVVTHDIGDNTDAGPLVGLIGTS